MRQEELAKRPARAPDALDSVVVEAGPGAIIRVDTLVVRGTEREPHGVDRVLVRRRGTSVRYEVRADAGYDSVAVAVGDTIAPATGTIVVNDGILLAAIGHAKPRSETKHLYDLMRAELVSKQPIAAFVAVECEMERLKSEYPATADRWIAEVSERAHDPESDAKAMRRLDDALNGHEFGGCTWDRSRYRAAP